MDFLQQAGVGLLVGVLGQVADGQADELAPRDALGGAGAGLLALRVGMELGLDVQAARVLFGLRDRRDRVIPVVAPGDEAALPELGEGVGVGAGHDDIIPGIFHREYTGISRETARTRIRRFRIGEGHHFPLELGQRDAPAAYGHEGTATGLPAAWG